MISIISTIFTKVRGSCRNRSSHQDDMVGCPSASDKEWGRELGLRTCDFLPVPPTSFLSHLCSPRMPEHAGFRQGGLRAASGPLRPQMMVVMKPVWSDLCTSAWRISRAFLMCSVKFWGEKRTCRQRKNLLSPMHHPIFSL